GGGGGGAGDAGQRRGESSARRGSLAVVRTGPRAHAAHQVLLRQSARDRVAQAAGAPRASALGHRAAISRAQDRVGARPLRGPIVPGLAYHVVLTAVAYAFLQRERMRHDADPAFTLPAVRAIVTEIFTALLFAQKPYYLKRIQELQNIQLRI